MDYIFLINNLERKDRLSLLNEYACICVIFYSNFAENITIAEQYSTQAREIANSRGIPDFKAVMADWKA